MTGSVQEQKGEPMSDGIMLVFGEDGVAREYDDTWDITIHCESEEEQKAVWEKLNNLNREVKNLTDTISRQAAIDEVVAWLRDRMTDGKNGKPLTERLKALPSAQLETITCNQCVHYQQNHHYCEFLDTEFSPSDYCSQAERREG